MNCSQVYQQTKFLTNPLNYEDEIDSASDEKLNLYNVKFILGEEKCIKQFFKSDQYCNEPLAPNVNYGLMARIYTNDAFRDTDPVYFKTNGLSETFMYLNMTKIPAIIVACLLLAMVVSTIMTILCCWSIKRQRKIEKKRKKESAETVENLLSFTSYCVIDKNPTPKTQFDQLL